MTCIWYDIYTVHLRFKDQSNLVITLRLNRKVRKHLVESVLNMDDYISPIIHCSVIKIRGYISLNVIYLRTEQGRVVWRV